MSGRGTVAVTFVVAAALGGGTAAVAVGARHDKPRAAEPSSLPPAATATVTRTDLVATVQVDGSLDYGPTRPVAGHGTGTVTSLPAVGQTVSRGQTLYGLDGVPVPLFYGAVPFWRPMSVGVPDGDDVLELQQNLAALGYQGFTVDRHFGWSTENAVEQWQHDLGMAQTGTVDPGAAVVEPDAVRVATVSGVLGGTIGAVGAVGAVGGSVGSGTGGGAAGSPLMTVTGTTKEVTVPMPVGQAASVATPEAAVALELPGGGHSTGHIDHVGSVATAAAGSGPADSAAGTGTPNAATQNATIPVTIRLDNPAAVAGLDGSPVTVDFTGEARRGVLTVPVSALLATQDGGFGVEVVAADGTRHTVPVRAGMFANGLVEVSGDGITAGTTVTVAGA